MNRASVFQLNIVAPEASGALLYFLIMKQLSTAMNRRDGEAQRLLSAALRLCGLYLLNHVPNVQECDATGDAM